jgi:hypothetical protein
MTPKQYLDRYTYLRFFSPFNNEQVLCPITGYGSGWGKRGDDANLGGQCQTEIGYFVKAMRVAHHGNANSPCGARFTFSSKPLGLIPTTEEFFPETFTHAFNGKGSPDEITDTLRIAMAVGRIGVGRDLAGQQAARSTPAQYAAAFMTLDCNVLVGNFYGGNPDAEIMTYANAARKRSSATAVTSGDCVVTHSATSPYEHIALIDEWSVSGSSATVTIVEWGWKGGEEVHYKKDMKVTVTTGPDKSFGIGWSTTSPKDGKPSFRYIFARPKDADPHGWS